MARRYSHQTQAIQSTTMTDIHEWLKNVHHYSYIPVSSPPGPSLEPMDGILSTDDLADQITLLDIDKDGHMCFDMSHAWNEQPQINNESIPIDPSLYTMTNFSTTVAPGQSVITVPEHLAEASSRLLIHLLQIVEIPETVGDLDGGTAEGTILTTEELEALEPVNEQEFEPVAPSAIGGIPVNTNPNSQEIKEIVDLRRIGPYRRTFYLAKSIDGNYYWFHAPRAERDHQLRELIRDHRHQSHANDDHKGTSSVKTLRSRKIIMT